jgi:hypothetical protein
MKDGNTAFSTKIPQSLESVPPSGDFLSDNGPDFEL